MLRWAACILILIMVSFSDLYSPLFVFVVYISFLFFFFFEQISIPHLLSRPSSYSPVSPCSSLASFSCHLFSLFFFKSYSPVNDIDIPLREMYVIKRGENQEVARSDSFLSFHLPLSIYLYLLLPPSPYIYLDHFLLPPKKLSAFSSFDLHIYD